jgi:hypothetical protein
MLTSITAHQNSGGQVSIVPRLIAISEWSVCKLYSDYQIEIVMKILPEVVGQTSSRPETRIDSDDLFWLQLLNPARIVESLRHNFTRRSFALEFN